MCKSWIAPTSANVTVHHVNSIDAENSGVVPGGISIGARREGFETFAVTFFTDNAALAADLAAAINDVAKKHAVSELTEQAA